MVILPLLWAFRKQERWNSDTNKKLHLHPERSHPWNHSRQGVPVAYQRPCLARDTILTPCPAGGSARGHSPASSKLCCSREHFPGPWPFRHFHLTPAYGFLCTAYRLISLLLMMATSKSTRWQNIALNSLQFWDKTWWENWIRDREER